MTPRIKNILVIIETNPGKINFRKQANVTIFCKILQNESATYFKKVKVHSVTDREGPEREQVYSSTLSLTSALDEVGLQRQAPSAFSPVGPQGGLKGCGKSCQRQRDSISGPSSPQRVSIPTELPGPQ